MARSTVTVTLSLSLTSTLIVTEQVRVWDIKSRELVCNLKVTLTLTLTPKPNS